MLLCRVVRAGLSSDARAKVRHLALLIVSGTQPVTNLKILTHVGELTGKEEDKQKWGQQQQQQLQHTAHNDTLTSDTIHRLSSSAQELLTHSVTRLSPRCPCMCGQPRSTWRPG